MSALPQIAEPANEQDFEFDYDHNAVHFKGERIHLTPREADIIHVLLNNRARTTPLSVLIQRVYGASEPETAAIAIRVAVHALRKKLRNTGIKIKAEAHVGYEIDADAVPSLNRRLSDKILIAINTAKASGEHAIAARLQAAYDMAEARRQEYRAAHGEHSQDVIKNAEPKPQPQNVIAAAPRRE
jgi:DNA-binding winged helix-turn-helix (wHTH) protein